MEIGDYLEMDEYELFDQGNFSQYKLLIGSS